MALITFIGGGSFGTALAISLSKQGHTIKIYDRDKSTVDDINLKRENIKYLHNVVIPFNVIAYNDIHEAIRDSEFVFLAVPSHAIRTVCDNILPYLNEKQIIVSMAKGIEEDTLKRLSQVIKEQLPKNPIVVISGPSHAEEIALDLPTTLVVSSEEMKYAYIVQDIIMTKRLRVYTNDDIVGIEIGGAIKNVIALACGISDGIGFGDNAKAAIMTRGMNEIIKIGMKLGGREQTFYGLTGMGDLIVTCTSIHSRNRRAGILIGQGKSCKDACQEVGMVVEGVKACKAFHQLGEKLNLSLPITDTLYDILFNGKDLKLGAYNLMSRDKKDEYVD